MITFVAIDFETADTGKDSACAIGLVKVRGNAVAGEAYHLIRPPRPSMVFEYLHGISWSQVADKPTFHELWPELEAFMRDANFLVAHNAPFDRSVLTACCEKHALVPPQIPFLCTVKLARQVWRIYPTKLPNVCSHLNIPLNHHHAASDSLACAEIVIRAASGGADLSSAFIGTSLSAGKKQQRSTAGSTPTTPHMAEVKVSASARDSRSAQSPTGGSTKISTRQYITIGLLIVTFLWLLSVLI